MAIFIPTDRKSKAVSVLCEPASDSISHLDHTHTAKIFTTQRLARQHLHRCRNLHRRIFGTMAVIEAKFHATAPLGRPPFSPKAKSPSPTCKQKEVFEHFIATIEQFGERNATQPLRTCCNREQSMQHPSLHLPSAHFGASSDRTTD